MMLRGAIPITAVLVSLLAGCGGSSGSPQTVTVTNPTTVQAAAPMSTAPPVSDVTIPEVAGRNAEIVREELEKQLGLTEVSLSSTNPEYSVVMMATNWTAVSIEPPPGTVVKSDQQVVLKVYKD